MERAMRRRGDRRRMGIALVASAAAHALVFGFVKLHVPGPEEAEGHRPLQVIELRDAWRERAVEVVALESAVEPSGEAGAETASAAPEADLPGALRAVGAEAPVGPGAAEGAPALSLALLPGTEATTPAIQLPRSNRGVIKRIGGGGARGNGGYDIVAASEAAREAERERGGNGWGGTGGIGVTIGGGGDCDTPGVIPGLGLPSGLGGLPGGNGRGIIGRRPGGGGAINRVLPGGR